LPLWIHGSGSRIALNKSVTRLSRLFIIHQFIFEYLQRNPAKRLCNFFTADYDTEEDELHLPFYPAVHRPPQPVSAGKYRPRNGPNHFSLLTSPFLVPAQQQQQPPRANQRPSHMDPFGGSKRGAQGLAKGAKKTLGKKQRFVQIYCI
jgi:hypothetical protein